MNDINTAAASAPAPRTIAHGCEARDLVQGRPVHRTSIGPSGPTTRLVQPILMVANVHDEYHARALEVGSSTVWEWDKFNGRWDEYNPDEHVNWAALAHGRKALFT